MEKIPKTFIRVWIGENKIPAKFQEWWADLKVLHPDYKFLTLVGNSLVMPQELLPIMSEIKTCAGVSDVIRLVALYRIGGIYLDTDVMPIKSFDPLVESTQPFLAKRSSKSFESAVIGSPKEHPSFLELIKRLPEWYYKHKDRSASVQTGPAFVSSVLFGRKDITHLPSKTFYPYNGFGAPKRDAKIKLFSDKNNFPKEMIAAHFSNHRWGGKP